MLSSISWQQYFAAIAIVSVSYYIYILLRYYQREITGLFTPKQKASLLAQTGALSTIDVMGRPRQDHNFSIVDDQELQFAEDEVNENVEQATATPINTSCHNASPQEQLIAEMDNLIKAFADVDSKSEFISLFNILISSYDQYQDEINYEQVSGYVISKSHSFLPFDLITADLPTVIK
jgi:hypothetical protein